MNWEEVIAQATKLCSGTYKIGVDGDRFRMDARRSEVSIEVEKADENIVVRSDYWLPATGIGLLLNWFNEKGYSYSHIRSQSIKK